MTAAGYLLRARAVRPRLELRLAIARAPEAALRFDAVLLLEDFDRFAVCWLGCAMRLLYAAGARGVNPRAAGGVPC